MINNGILVFAAILKKCPNKTIWLIYADNEEEARREVNISAIVQKAMNIQNLPTKHDNEFLNSDTSIFNKLTSEIIINELGNAKFIYKNISYTLMKGIPKFILNDN